MSQCIYWVLGDVVNRNPIWNSWAMPRKTTLYANAPELAQLGAAIRKARKAAGMAQETLAHAAEIERSYFGALERGEVNATFMVLVKVSRELRVPLADLLADARL